MTYKDKKKTECLPAGKKVRIVAPDPHGKDIATAISEAKYFLDQAGASVADEGADITLSLGRTDLAEKAGLIHIADDLYDDGFEIRTEGGVCYIVSADERGVLFGVYEWLHELAGLEVYSSEQFEIGEFALRDVNKRVNPSLAYRARGWYPWNKYDEEIKNRLRYTEPNWITFAHSMLSILPKSKYYKDHPDWYSTPMGQQLCFTNEEMAEAFIKESLERYITPEHMHGKRTACFFVGQEDNGYYCQCERCRESYKKLGLSGTMILFVKKVAKAVNEYVEKTMPGCIVKTVTFAYAETNKLPVDDNGKPLDPSVVFEKNMGVMITVGSHCFTDEIINNNKKYLADCKTLGGEAYIWAYDSIFDDELIFLHTLEQAEFYNKLFIENGAMLHYDQGHYNANISFDELSNYVRAKLMWDISLDSNTLAHDFIRAFYGEGAKEVATYYDEICALENSWPFRNEVSLYVRKALFLKTPAAFPKDKLIRWINILTEGIEKTSEDRVKLRIARERLTPIYLLMEIYGDKLDKAYAKRLTDEFYKDALENNVAYYAEHGPENFQKDMHTKITQWRSLFI